MSRLPRIVYIARRPVHFRSKARPSPATDSNKDKPCTCCINVLHMVLSLAFFAAGYLMLAWIDGRSEGFGFATALGLQDFRPLLGWPVMIWMAIAAFAFLNEAMKCLKLPFDHLQKMLGKPPAPSAVRPLDRAGSGPPRFPEMHWNGAGLVLMPAAAAAAAAVTVAVSIHASVKLTPAADQASLSVPVAFTEQDPQKGVKVWLDVQPSVIRPEISVTSNAEVILKPDEDVRKLVAQLLNTATELKKHAVNEADLEKLVRASQALSDTSASMLAWSLKAEQDRQNYGTQMHEVMAQFGGVKHDFEHVRRAIDASWQTQYPARWFLCEEVPANGEVRQSTPCQKLTKDLKSVVKLNGGQIAADSGSATVSQK